MAGGMRVKELENDYEVFQYDDNYSEDEKQRGAANKGGQGQLAKDLIVDASEIQLKMKKKKGRVHIDDGLSSEEDKEDPKDK